MTFTKRCLSDLLVFSAADVLYRYWSFVQNEANLEAKIDSILAPVTLEEKNHGIDKITVTANVSNTGSKEGAEVAQVYVGKPKSKVEPALKELRGFQKVNVGASQSAQVSIEVDVQDLKYYDKTN